MNKNLTDEQLRIFFKEIKTIVMVGLSASPLRASFFVARYFVLRGITVMGRKSVRKNFRYQK